jgi:hypothetical protein
MIWYGLIHIVFYKKKKKPIILVDNPTPRDFKIIYIYMNSSVDFNSSKI